MEWAGWIVAGASAMVGAYFVRSYRRQCIGMEDELAKLLPRLIDQQRRLGALMAMIAADFDPVQGHDFREKSDE